MVIGYECFIFIEYSCIKRDKCNKINKNSKIFFEHKIYFEDFNSSKYVTEHVI